MSNFDKGLEAFNPKKAELLEMSKEYKGLTIKGIDDKEGYKKVHEARMKLVTTRTTIKKQGLELRNDANAFAKKVIEVEKELIDIIEPTEKELLAEEERIDAMKEEIKQKAEREAQEKLQKRVDELAKFDKFIDLFELRIMEEQTYQETLENAKQEWLKKEEEKRLQEEQEKKAREELLKQQEEARKKQEELEAREAKILETEKKLEAERLAKEREEEIKREREEAAEKARIETEQRIKREAIEKAEKEKAEMERLEKEKKYKKWLSENYVDDGTMKIVNDDGKIVIWKKISEWKS